MTRFNIAQPDITLHLDKEGMIKDVSLSDGMVQEDVDALVGKSWAETVGDVGGNKVRSMLEQALTHGVSAFRQVNQHFPSGTEVPIEFTTVRLGGQAGIVAIGKNLQTVAELQSRLVAAQQSLERDYWKYREVETRYRTLFESSVEAVLVVDGVRLSILEANPAATRALGAMSTDHDFLPLLPSNEQPSVRAMLDQVRDQGRAPGVLVHLNSRTEPWMLRASRMNASSRPAFLLQLASIGTARPYEPVEKPVDIDTGSLVDSFPDGFSVIDGDGVILKVNQAFLDLVQIGARSRVIGERLGRWLGRPGADLAILLANINQYGLIRLFTTTIHGELGTEAEVEISAASRVEDNRQEYVVLIRDVGTRLAAPKSTQSTSSIQGAIAKPIGSAPLRDLVGETTGLIEQHYIEAALELTGGNRKAAAELLGLSRQGLYAKLGRYSLNGDTQADNQDRKK